MISVGFRNEMKMQEMFRIKHQRNQTSIKMKVNGVCVPSSPLQHCCGWQCGGDLVNSCPATAYKKSFSLHFSLPEFQLPMTK